MKTYQVPRTRFINMAAENEMLAASGDPQVHKTYTDSPQLGKQNVLDGSADSREGLTGTRSVWDE